MLKVHNQGEVNQRKNDSKNTELMLRKWAVYQNVNYRNSFNLFTIATECIYATVNALENTKKNPHYILLFNRRLQKRLIPCLSIYWLQEQ